MRVCYSLSRYVAGFDFFNWLVLAVADGATEVLFATGRPKTDKWNLGCVLRRFESILFPGPALAGLTALRADAPSGDDRWNPNMGHLVRHCQNGGRIQKLVSVNPPGQERYTVTLRKTQRCAKRDSNELDWRAFAEEIGARVIEDYDVEPIGLHERVALYAGAEMNFFVANGPMHLCSLTPYPMMCFFAPHQSHGFVHCGMPFGSQYPWSGDNQFLIWEPDTLDVIRKHFDAWRR